MLRVGKDKITQERLIHTHSFDDRDLIAGHVVISIEYGGWVTTSVRTQEAQTLKVTLVEARGFGDNTSPSRITVEGKIDSVVTILNSLNGTPD